MKKTVQKLITGLVIFMGVYFGALMGIWGVLEGATYFQGDALKKAVGGYWPLLMYGVPVLFAIAVLAYRRYMEAPEATDLPVSQKQEPLPQERVSLYSELDHFLIDFKHDLSLADQLVGRTEVFAALEQFQASNESGYFRVTADTGLGKTTLAAGVAKLFDAPSFFCNSSRAVTRTDQCLNHLSVTLIKRFSLPYDHLPPRAGEDSSVFENVLQAAAEKLTDRPLWIVVDGLDEANEATLGRNTLLLPAYLPPGVFFFLTQRPGNYPLRTDPDTPVDSYEIFRDSDEQRSDISEFLEQRIQTPKIIAALAKLGSEFDKRALVSSLEKASEGSFMYLRYVLADIEAGKLSLAGAAQGSPEISIPRGLVGYYESIWSQMQDRAGTGNGNQWSTVYRPIIGLLAAAREPVTLKWFSDLSGVTSDDLRDRVLSAWTRFLGHEQKDQKEYFRILHKSFADFLDEKIELAEVHKSIAAYYRQPSQWTKDQGYASKHLSTHLRLAGSLEELFSLVKDTGWYESQMVVDPTGMAYGNDLFVAWSAASDDNLSMVQTNRPAAWLSQEISFALATASLDGFWRNIRPSALMALLKANVLTDGQALDLATKNPDESVRAILLRNLIPLLSKSQLPAAIKSVDTITGKEKIDPLLALATRVDNEKDRDLLNEALEITNEMEGAEKIEKLVALAQRLDEPERLRLLQSARTLAMSLDDADAESRAAALLELASAQPEDQQLIEAALSAIRELDDHGRVVEDSIKIIELLDSERRAPFITKVLDLCEKLEDAGSKASLLTSMAPLAVDHARTLIVDTARAAIGSVVEREQQASLLLSLAEVVEDPLQGALLLEAENAAREITEDTVRAVTLAEVAGKHFHLSDQARRTSAAEAALNEATTLVRGLTEPLTKARTLVTVALALPDEQLVPLVQEAARIPGSILILGGLERDDVEQVELLATLSRRLAAPGKEDVVQHALSIARHITRDYDRGRALASLLPCLEPESQAEVFNELQIIGSALDGPAERAELFTAAVAYASADQREILLQQAVEAARSIVPAALTVTGTIDMETGRVEIDRYPENLGNTPSALLDVAMKSDATSRTQLIDEAFEFLFDLTDAQSGSIKRIAPHLSADQVRKILNDYRLVLNDPERQQFLANVTERLEAAAGEQTEVYADERFPDQSEPETEAAEALVEETDQDDESQLLQFSRGPIDKVFRLVRSPNQIGFDIKFSAYAWESADQEQQLRRDIIADAVSSEPIQSLEQIRQSATDFKAGAAWRQTLAALLERLTATESVSVALEEAKAIWPEQLPPEVAGSLVSYMSAADSAVLLSKALASARQVEDLGNRVSAFAYLAPHLDDTDRDEARREVVSALEQIVRQEDGPQGFLHVLKNLPEVPSARELFPVVQLLLRLTPTRRELLKNLRQVLPMIAGVEVPGTAASIAEEVIAVCTKWR